MNETSQAQFSPAGAPPRKKNVRPVGRPARSPDILAAAGAMIRERRESQGKSLRQLADLTDRSHGYIGDVERGKCSICFDLAARLAVVLDLDLAEILCAFRVVPEHAAERFFDVDRMRAALAAPVAPKAFSPRFPGRAPCKCVQGAATAAYCHRAQCEADGVDPEDSPYFDCPCECHAEAVEFEPEDDHERAALAGGGQ